MIIDNVPEQVSEDNVIELANEFTEYLENSGNLFFQNYQSSVLTLCDACNDWWYEVI